LKSLEHESETEKQKTQQKALTARQRAMVNKETPLELLELPPERMSILAL
jgi:hypothetical protein